MDYKGQKLAEHLLFYITIFCGLIGFFIGYQKESFAYAGYGTLIGTLISGILCIPDWPFYNRHPIKWLPKQKHPNSPKVVDTPNVSSSGTVANTSEN